MLHGKKKTDGVEAIEVDELEDAVVTVVITGEQGSSGSLTVETTDDELNLSINTNAAE